MLRPTQGEKIAELRSGLVRQHARKYFRMMIQTLLGKNIDQAPARARLEVIRSIHEPRYPCVHDRPRTHQAWLERDEQFAADQPVIADGLRGIAQCQHFSMGRRVMAQDWRIETAPDDFPIFYHHRAHRHLTGLLRLVCQRQCEAHVICIGHESKINKA